MCGFQNAFVGAGPFTPSFGYLQTGNGGFGRMYKNISCAVTRGGGFPTSLFHPSPSHFCIFSNPSAPPPAAGPAGKGAAAVPHQVARVRDTRRHHVRAPCPRAPPPRWGFWGCAQSSLQAGTQFCCLLFFFCTAFFGLICTPAQWCRFFL